MNPASATDPQTPPPPPPADPKPQRKSLLDQVVDETARRRAENLLVEENLFAHHQRIAKLFVLSGMYADLKKVTEEQGIARAVVKIQLGETMDMTPVEALQSFYFVNGKPQVEAAFRGSRLQLYGYSWVILWHDNTGCCLELWRGDKPVMRPKVDPKTKQQLLDTLGNKIMEPVTETFTEQDAKTAGLYDRPQSDGQPNMYQKWPKNMYYNRALTNLQRFWAPHVLGKIGGTIASVEETMMTEGIRTEEQQTAHEFGMSQTNSREAQAELAERKIAEMRAQAANQPQATPPPTYAPNDEPSEEQMRQWEKDQLEREAAGEGDKPKPKYSFGSKGGK